MCMENHLSEEQLAIYIDALISDKQDQLPKKFLEHLEECFEGKVEELEVRKIIKQFNNSKIACARWNSLNHTLN